MKIGDYIKGRIELESDIHQRVAASRMDRLESDIRAVLPEDVHVRFVEQDLLAAAELKRRSVGCTLTLWAGQGVGTLFTKREAEASWDQDAGQWVLVIDGVAVADVGQWIERDYLYRVCRQAYEALSDIPF